MSTPALSHPRVSIVIPPWSGQVARVRESLVDALDRGADLDVPRAATLPLLNATRFRRAVARQVRQIWLRGPRLGRPRPRVSVGRRPTETPVDRPARVLYLDAFPKIGGGQQVLLSIIRALAPARYVPLVGLPPESPLRCRLAQECIPSIGISFDDSNRSLPNLRNPVSLLQTLFSAARVMREIYSVARRQEVDVIHANSVLAGVYALPVAIRLGIPCAVHSHDFRTARPTNAFVKLMLRYQRSVIIFVSAALARSYGADSRAHFHSRVIHNGIDVHAFRPDLSARGPLLKECGFPDDVYLIGAVGRIEAGKGFGLLLDVFAQVATRHPQARLVLVGEVLNERQPDARAVLQDKVERLGLSGRVAFTGFREDMPSVMSALDVLVHCPIEPEAFGLILAEAMACGRPVVAVAAGGMTEVVVDGVNGLLAPVGDTERIAAAISRLILEPELGARLGVSGRRMVEETISAERQGLLVQQLYDDLLHRDSEPPQAGNGPRVTGAPALRG